MTRASRCWCWPRWACFAAVLALDAVRVVSDSEVLSSVEIYPVAVPGVACSAALLLG